MTTSAPAPALQAPLRALLDLVESDRSTRCASILREARSRAEALRKQAHGEARARMRQAFEEQHQHRRERLAAAKAQLATQHRLHEQQRSALLLRQAWLGLAAALRSRWAEPAARAEWVRWVLSHAQRTLPREGWLLMHAPDWPAHEQQAVQTSLLAEGRTAPVFRPEASIRAGLKASAAGNVIDGTLEGLLADRAAIEARLLRLLENTP